MANVTLNVTDAKGQATGTVEAPEALFGVSAEDVQAHIPLIHQVVTAQLAAARQGTHATKTRGMVSGGGKKPWKQKGINEIMKAVGKYEQYKGVMNQLKDNLDCRESNLGLLKRSNQAEELAVQMLSALDSCIQTGKALPERLDRNFE